MAGFAIGVDTSGVYPAFSSTSINAESGRVFGLNDMVETQDGKRWIFVSASTSITSYNACAIDTQGYALHATSANALTFPRIGVAQNNISSGSWGWLQVYGVCSLNVLSTCSTGVSLYVSGTAGSLDDTGTATVKVTGISIPANITAAATSAAIMACEPFASL